MSKDNLLAFHGSGANYNQLKTNDWGLVPPSVWKSGNDIPKKATLRKGVGDADLNVSVSVSWSARTSCFFPPEKVHIYLYFIDMTGLDHEDVDKFAKTQGVHRGYMKECALGQVPLANIVGYTIVTRRPPPADITKIVVHEMQVLAGPCFETPHDNLGKARTAYSEYLNLTRGKFKIAKSIAGTFQTTDSAPKVKMSMQTNKKRRNSFSF